MSTPPTSRRLLGLDQARAVAILAMLAAHFAPGVFAQVPRLAPLRVPVLAFARLATPTFVVVFGVTVGFVYLPRYLRGEPGPTARHLRRRAGVMLLCAVAVALPFWARLTAERRGRPVGLAVRPVLGAPLLRAGPGRAPGLAAVAGRARALDPRAVRPAVAGVGLWALGTAGHTLVPQRPPAGGEFVRMMLVSGSFATAIDGHGPARRPGRGPAAGRVGRRDGPPVPRAGCSWPGLALAALGGLWGLAAGEYDPARLLSGELRTPPRAWYFLHIGGMGLALVPALELLTRAARAAAAGGVPAGPVRPGRADRLYRAHVRPARAGPGGPGRPAPRGRPRGGGPGAVRRVLRRGHVRPAPAHEPAKPTARPAVGPLLLRLLPDRQRPPTARRRRDVRRPVLVGGRQVLTSKVPSPRLPPAPAAPSAAWRTARRRSGRCPGRRPRTSAGRGGRPPSRSPGRPDA